MPQFESLKPDSLAGKPSETKKPSVPKVQPEGQWTKEQINEAKKMMKDVPTDAPFEEKIKLFESLHKQAEGIQLEKKEALVKATREINGRTSEGVEVKIDLPQEIQKWNQFYQKYEIKDDKGKICQLSESLRLTPEQIEQAKQDIEQFGFDTILIIPKGVKNRDLLNNDKLLTYPENETKSTEEKRYIDSDMLNDVLDATTTQTQIILLKNSPDVYQDDDWDSHNQTFPAVLDKEKELGITGFDIPYFLFFHRSYYEKTLKEKGTGVHPHVWQENQATWFSKTATEELCARVYWFSDNTKLFFFWSRTGLCGTGLGAVFTRSFEAVT